MFNHLKNIQHNDLSNDSDLEAFQYEKVEVPI